MRSVRVLLGALVAGLMTAGALVATPGTAASARAVRPCTNAELTASYRPGGAGLGHHYGRLVLRNTSKHACRTGGYGGLSYVGHGDGTQIGAAADRTPSHVRSFVVRPGQRLISQIDAMAAGNYPRRRCRPAHVDGFRVYVPNETRSQYVPHPTRGCRNRHIHLLAHKAYRRP